MGNITVNAFIPTKQNDIDPNYVDLDFDSIQYNNAKSKSRGLINDNEDYNNVKINIPNTTISMEARTLRTVHL